MKYLISESQYILILEENLPVWIRRRLSGKESFSDFIDQAQDIYNCEDFSDEFEYADNVISAAVDDFLTTNEDTLESYDENYDELHDTVTEIVKEWYGEYLFNEFYNCTN